MASGCPGGPGLRCGRKRAGIGAGIWAYIFLTAGRGLPGEAAGVPVGAALMTMPGPGALAVAGLIIVGLAAAPVFPLFTLTTAQRTAAADLTGTVSLQVAASAAGGAAVPAGLGLAIGAFDARMLAPVLLVLGLTMCGLYLVAAFQAQDA